MTGDKVASPDLSEGEALGDFVGRSDGDLEGVRVGSFVLGPMVGVPGGRAGQNTGQALEVSVCGVFGL